jgi:hypothetical protein
MFYETRVSQGYVVPTCILLGMSVHTLFGRRTQGAQDGMRCRTNHGRAVWGKSKVLSVAEGWISIRFF